jgi:serine/threonine protein kinase
MEQAQPVDNIIQELEQIHHYEIISEVGEGSFGTVFKAKSKIDNKTYAIKIYKSPFKSSYSARQTYREIKIMRKLSEVPSNSFTPKIHDIILPSTVFDNINQELME